MAKKVFVDPGHGGTDPGAVDGKGTGDNVVTVESRINLAIAKYLLSALARCGFDTRTSRTGDVLPTLAQRTAMANEWGADIFISLHINAAAATAARGAEVIYHPNSVAGQKLAKDIFRYVSIVTPWSDRTVYADVRGLYVLNHSKMPAALVEYGFLTNTAEEALLNEPGYQKKLAEATAMGVCTYFGVAYVKPPTTVTIPKPPAPTPVPKPPAYVPPTLRKGSTGAVVVKLQRILNAKKPWYRTRLVQDGIFGAKTDAAVRDFQKRNKLVVDGIVGPKTWAKLLG